MSDAPLPSPLSSLPAATEAEARDPEARPYAPVGSARALMSCHATEVVLSGPAGTGKSRACLEKLHRACEKYPGVRGLILRKTRASLTEAALVTFESKVVPRGHPILEGASRAMRQSYRYPNGSTLVVGGLDKPGKIMSTEFDLAYVQEAIELTEDGWESITTRLRNGAMPYQQLLADTNPDSPQHWLKRRCDAGRTRLIPCRHEDNPTLWDAAKKEWLPAGVDYIAKLDALTGPRKLRLRDGRWVQAEGVVYEGWDMAVHLIDRFEIPDGWTRFLAVDFGYTNPFVCQWWAMDPDGRMYRYREVYFTGRLVEDHARRIKELQAGEPVPQSVVCDTDAEDRATLERHLGLGTEAAMKDVSPGIQAVATRLKVAGDGKARLFLLRDSLDERDPRLSEAKKPCCTEEEFDGYIWNPKAKRGQGEEPLKFNDHGMDCARYATVYADTCAGAWSFGYDERDSLVGRMPADVFLPERERDDDGEGHWTDEL